MLGSHAAEVPKSCPGALTSQANTCFSSLKHPSIFPINACPCGLQPEGLQLAHPLKESCSCCCWWW